MKHSPPGQYKKKKKKKRLALSLRDNFGFRTSKKYFFIQTETVVH